MIIYLVLILVILFAGAKISSKGEFHDDFLSLKITKGIQGICAIAIICHHFIQNVVTAKQDPGVMMIFHDAGYLMVAIFFFCSGYGLFVSYKNKKNYLKGFLKKRIPMVLVPLFLINTIYTIVALAGGTRLYTDLNPLSLGMDSLLFKITTFLCITPMNGNSWFIITITLFYIMFYVLFRNSRDENKSIRKMGVFVVVYAVVGMCLPPVGIFWLEGEWWYDASFIFFIGILVAKNEQSIVTMAKKDYKLLLPLSLICTMALWYGSITLDKLIGAYGHGISGVEGALICYLSKTVTEMAFVGFVFLLAMKVRANNAVLNFLGKIAFEIYLIHGLYLGIFRSEVMYIESPIVYFSAIILCTITSAVILNKINLMLVRYVKKLV